MDFGGLLLLIANNKWLYSNLNRLCQSKDDCILTVENGYVGTIWERALLANPSFTLPLYIVPEEYFDITSIVKQHTNQENVAHLTEQMKPRHHMFCTSKPIPNHKP